MQEEENRIAQAEGLTDIVEIKDDPFAHKAAGVDPDFVPPSCTESVSAEEAERILTDEELARKLQAEEQDHILAMKLQNGTATTEYGYDDEYEEEEEDDSYGPSRAATAAAVSAGKRSCRRNKKNKKKTPAAPTQQPATIVPEEVKQQLPLTETTVMPPTKHDVEVSGRRNAATLDRFIDGSGLDGVPRGPEVRALHEDEYDEEEEQKHAIKSIPDRQFTALREWTRKDESRRIRVKERTAEAQRKDTVMDEPAKLTILGLVNQNILSELHGVISAGKEAHVYHAFAGDATTEDGKRIIPEGWECALKVFKAVNEFKNRGSYLTPNLAEEFERSKQHPRACTKMWAQRELKNLQLLRENGVSCPCPIGLFGDSVLLMQFLGNDGVPAPTLREIEDRELSSRRWAALYKDCVLMTHKMFNCCGLIHGDLSEYNILFWEGKPWFIDVAQGVSVLHADALDFLRRDCTTLTAFFEKKGVKTLSADAFFRFVQTNTPPVLPETEGEPDEKPVENVEKAEAKPDEKPEGKAEEKAEDKAEGKAEEKAAEESTEEEVVKQRNYDDAAAEELFNKMMAEEQQETEKQ